MHKRPEITVLMPVRDAGPRLQQAVESILRQSYTNFEFLIIDDHSTDSAIDRLGVDDPRMRILTNTGTGLVDALNLGIECAAGEWIARMDGDDIATVDRLASQRRYADRHPDVGLIGAQVQIFRDNDNTPAEGYRHYQRWINRLTTPEQISRERFIESPIPHPTAFIRRATLDAIGRYRDCGWAEDYDLWLRLAEYGVSMGKPDGTLLYWRDHDERLSRTASQYSASQFLRLKAHFLARHFPHDQPVCLWGAGPNGKKLFDLLTAAGTTVSQFIDVHPRRIGGKARDRPVRSATDIADIHDPVIVAVGSRGVREEIRSALQNAGRVEGDTFLFAM